MRNLQDVIVIGATGSDFDALCTVIGGLEATATTIILVALQSSPVRPGRAADLLAHCARLPVCYGHHKAELRPCQIYLSPPDRHLIVAEPDFLLLKRGPRGKFAGSSTDQLFQSAALVYGPRVVGVVLSGYGGDSLVGCCAIKAAGGVVIVQDPAKARIPAMPAYVLSGIKPDYCPALDEIAGVINGLNERLDVQQSGRLPA